MSAPVETADTIAAIATASGGGLGVIRLSGPDALGIAERLFPPLRRGVRPRRLIHGWWHDVDGRPLDEGLVAVMLAPHSYTGEDVVELSVHGGALNLRRCVEACWAAGARPAEPGEFTRRAFLNGRMDLTQAEAVADLVAARTDRALAQARQHLQGRLSDVAMDAREAVLQLRARLEVNIDFVDEDVPLMDPEALAFEADEAASGLERLLATWDRGRLLREGARVVLAGEPNAGKSSLFNALCRADRAIVTAIAGTTRDVLEEQLDVLGVPVVLVDTAGLRDTGDVVEREGVARAERAASVADLLLWVVDPAARASRPPVGVGRIPTVKVSAKCDLPDREPLEGAVAVSARTGEGLEALERAIVEALGAGAGADGGLAITRERHKLALERAVEGLRRAARVLREGQPSELAAVDVQDATDALGELVGLTTIEDVLDRLFAGFCIGK